MYRIPCLNLILIAKLTWGERFLPDGQEREAQGLVLPYPYLSYALR
jgi:hypothetical protein